MILVRTEGRVSAVGVNQSPNNPAFYYSKFKDSGKPEVRPLRAWKACPKDLHNRSKVCLRLGPLTLVKLTAIPYNMS